MPDLIEIELPDESVRKLGNLAPLTSQPTKLTAVYGDFPQTPMIRREDWKPTSISHFLPPVKNQLNTGECNAFATVYCLEGCRAVQGHSYGSSTYAKLSPGFLYGKINGGSDNGSYLEDALEEMTKKGTCKASTVGEIDWRSRPAGAAEEAMYFRFLEVYWCPLFEHMASALQCGFFVNCGLQWYPNYNTDGDGWLPMRGVGSRPGGHALCRSGLAMNKDGRTWGLPGPNSWSTNWGANGYGTIPEPLFNEAVGGFWALRGAVDEGGIVPVPPSA